MKIEMVKTNKIAFDIIKTSYGDLFHLENVQIYKGNYLIKNEKIPFASLHEFADNKQWFIDRASNSGEVFGGKDENDFLIKLPYLEMRDLPQPTERLCGKYYMFQYGWDFNYLHFLISAFSRLASFFDAEKKVEDIKILVKKSTPQYQKDFINHIFKDKIYVIDDSKAYICENVYIMDFVSNDADKLVRFYDSLNLNLDINKKRNTFISRKDASKKRPLKNEIELGSLAKQNGYGEYILSDYTILEKSKIFASSEKILATLGAGIANIVFCKSCKQIIFINHPVYKVPEIVNNICKIKDIDLVQIDSLNIKWIMLRVLYKILKFFGIKKHEWSNDYSWKINVSKIKQNI